MIENESGEDYLEAILRLSSDRSDVHSVDVARELGVSKPAVTKAMRLLTQKGYVTFHDKHIYLTASGKNYAVAVYEKHKLITEFLRRLGVSEGAAQTDACRMEHVISGETYSAIKNFMEKTDA